MSRLKEVFLFFSKPIGEWLLRQQFRKIAKYNKYVKKLKIKENTFLLESYHGVNTTGNVYALFNQLIEANPSGKYYWVVDDFDNPMIPYLIKDNKNVKTVKYESKKYLALLASCEFLLNDTSFMPYFLKKNEQKYINTWHGTPLKTLGLDIKDAAIHDHKNIQRNLLQADYLFMPNMFTANKLLGSHALDGIYPSNVFLTGNPRVDNIFLPKNKVKEKYKLPKNKKIVLYAPTWKKKIEETTDQDIEELLNEVEFIQLQLPSDSLVLLKAHYFIYEKFVEKGYSDKIIPNWVDTNELLSVVDKLITDYSSIFFDYLPLDRPIYFYIPDKNSYEKMRGFYLDINSLPGYVSDNIIDISKQLNVDSKQYIMSYKEKITTFKKQFCSYDDGSSSRRVVDIILGNSDEKPISFNDNKRLIVMYGGGLYNNGITNSLINLSKQIDYDKFDFIILESEKMNKMKENNLKKIDPRARILYKFSYSFRTFSGTYNQNMYWRQGYNSKFYSKKIFQEDMQLEFKRLFGMLTPEIFVDFGGYNKVFNALVAFSSANKKSVFLHNRMFEEYNKREGESFKHKWNLSVIFSSYNLFDNIISVSESANEQNILDLKQFNVDSRKMKYVNNIVDGEQILLKSQSYKEINEGNLVKSSIDSVYRLPYEEKINKFGVQQVTAIPPIDSNRIKFVNVARLSPEKNQLNLIKAFKTIHQKYPQTVLYIVGDGPLADALLSYTKEQDLEDAVQFYGFLDNPCPIIELSDCFIFPSNYEGQGLALIEAMILRKPVLGTNVTGIKSVLKDFPDSLMENNVKDIVLGMEKFLNHELAINDFDYQAYNQYALNLFYNIVC